jgi:hypothetical protein
MFTVAQGELAEGHVEGAAMGEIRNDASDVPRADGGCESKTAYDRCSAPGASRSRGQADGYDAKWLARRIDSVRTEGIGAEY